MIFKIELDLNEIFGDEEMTLNESIVRGVVGRIERTVWGKVKGYVEHTLTVKLHDDLKKMVDDKILSLIKEFVSKNEIKENFYSTTTTTIDEYINRQFIGAKTSIKINSALVEAVDDHVKALRKRYDAEFSKQMLLKIHQQGWLRDDVTKILIGE